MERADVGQDERELQQQHTDAEQQKIKEAQDFAADVAAEKAEKRARGEGALPVPEENPGVAVVETPEKKPFWKLWAAKDAEPRKAEPAAGVTQGTEQATLDAGQPVRKDAKAATAEASARTMEKPVDGGTVLPVPEANPDSQVVEQTQKKPFWKFWQK